MSDKCASRYRTWIVTLNNPQKGVDYDYPDCADHDVANADAWLAIPDYSKIGKEGHRVRWVSWQLEEAPTTKTPHIQAVVQLDSPVGGKSFHGLLGLSRATHVPMPKPSPAGLNYAEKEETRISPTYYSAGEKPKTQGGAGVSKTEPLKKALLQGGVKAGWECDFELMLKYHQGAEKFVKTFTVPAERPDMKAFVIHGPPGTGKSFLCKSVTEVCFPDGAQYYKNIGPWWDFYHGQEVIIWDDFDGRGTPVRDVKNICDVYPCTVQVKGGVVNLESKCVAITTNTAPEEWYPEASAVDREAVVDRLRVFELLNHSAEDRKRVWIEVYLYLKGKDEGDIVAKAEAETICLERFSISDSTGHRQKRRRIQSEFNARSEPSIPAAPVDRGGEPLNFAVISQNTFY